MPARVPVILDPSVVAAPARACPISRAGLRLRDDLDAVLREAASLPELVVQLRHHDARLVVAGSFPDLPARLRLPARAAGAVVGHADRCPCCDSAGRISIHDSAARELVQICATADCASDVWMDLLLDLLPRPATAVIPVAVPPAPWSDSSETASDARAAQTLCALLNRIWPDNLRLDVTLYAGEAALSAALRPESGSVAQGLLGLRSADTTLQLLLPAVRRLVLVPSGLDPALEIHTRAPGEKLVLRCAAPAWRRALADLAPDLA